MCGPGSFEIMHLNQCAHSAAHSLTSSAWIPIYSKYYTDNVFTQFIRNGLQPSSSEVLHSEWIHNTGPFLKASGQNVINMLSLLISCTTGLLLQSIDCFGVDTYWDTSCLRQNADLIRHFAQASKQDLILSSIYSVIVLWV